MVICGNGLDIDLDEFEQYEKRIAEKRKSRQVGDGDPQPQSSSNSTTNNTTTSVNDTCNGYDDLDEYLDKLVIEKKRNDASAIAVTTANTPHDNIMAATICNNKPPPASLPVLLYTFMSLLVFINCVHKCKKLSVSYSGNNKCFFFLYLYDNCSLRRGRRLRQC